MTVKEYAKSRGISYQAVYQIIKKKCNQEALADHVFKEGNLLALDDFAIEWIDQKRSTYKQNVIVQATNNRIEELEEEITRLHLKLEEAQELNVKLSNAVLEAHQGRELLIAQKVEAETKLALIEQKEKEAAPPEEPPKKSFWSKLFG